MGKPAKKDDKKPAKKDDKKPAKKDDKKPATPASGWDLKAKIGDTNALDSWDAYINMPQAAIQKTLPTFNKECVNGPIMKFVQSLVFDKQEHAYQLKDFHNFFVALKLLNANLSNGTAQGVYQKMLGNKWWAKFGSKMKAKGSKTKSTGAKVKAHLKIAGKNIKNAFNKIGKAVVKGGKKIGAKIKGGLKVKANVKAPKVNLKVKAKPKIGVKAKVGVKAPKLKVKAKVGAKKRRLQTKSDTSTGFLPALPTDNKTTKTDDKEPTIVPNEKEGVPVSKYSSDVDVPKDLSGDPDQVAPQTANLVKICFMLFAALLTMY